MTFIPNIYGKVSSENSKSSLSAAAFNEWQGQAQAGTLSDITLDASASAVDDQYTNRVIEIISGRAIGELALITAYVGASKVATAVFRIAPDSTSGFVIHKHSGRCQAQSLHSPCSIFLSTLASPFDEFYTKSYITITVPTLSGVATCMEVQSYNGASKEAKVSTAPSHMITSDTLYVVYGEGGTAASATASTLELQSSHGHSSIDNVYSGMLLEIYSGTGRSQHREISSYAASTRTVTVSPDWTATPDATSKYTIYGGWSGVLENVKDYAQMTASVSNESGERFILNARMSFDSGGQYTNEMVAQKTDRELSFVRMVAITASYARVRLIGMGTPVTGGIQTVYHTAKSREAIASADTPITSRSECALTKTVLAGNVSGGRFKDVAVSNEGSLLTEIVRPLSAFGELSAVHMTPISQTSFIYGLSDVITTFDAGIGVSVTTEGTVSTAQVQTIFLSAAETFPASGPGSYFWIYSGSGAQFYVWFDVGGGNADPAPGGTGLQVAIGGADAPSQVAAAASAAVDADPNFAASVLLGNIVQITNTASGDVSSIQPGTMPLTTTSSVTHDPLTSSALLTQAPAVGAYAVLQSERAIKYRPGQGVVCRFTCTFAAPAAGSAQIAGLGNQVSGLFFGYNDQSFGILHRKSGQPDIYKIQITAGAAAAGTILLTLDGVDFPIPVTAGTPAHNAHEMYINESLRHGNWLTDVVGDSLFVLSTTATGARSKSFSFSGNGVAGITALVSAVATGVAVENEWIFQNEWNIDKCDGYGAMPLVLNPLKGNVYQIQFQWLGYGALYFFIENPYTGQFAKVHVIRYANSNVVPSLTMPHMRSMFALWNSTGTNSMTIGTPSAAIFNEGSARVFDGVFSTSFTRITLTSSEEHVFSLKNNRIFGSKGNNTEMMIRAVTIANDSARGGTIRMYLNGTLGEMQFASVDSEQSSMSLSTLAEATIPSDGRLITTVPVAADSVADLGFIKDLNIIVHSMETLMFTVQRTSNTNIEVNISITWQEDR